MVCLGQIRDHCLGQATDRSLAERLAEERPDVTSEPADEDDAVARDVDGMTHGTGPTTRSDEAFRPVGVDPEFPAE